MPARSHDPRVLAALAGLVYAVVVFAWLRANGVSWTTTDPLATAGALAYGLGGLFLLGAVPVYLLGRLSLVTPVMVTLGLLGDTVYQWAYGAHLHPLSSYLIVWPLLFGLGTQRVADRGGLGPLV